MSDNEIDAIVGRRVRERREALRMSQGRLGRHLGLTFSQIQKYEKGSNRIGAGRLYQIAQYLGVSPSYFFEPVEAAAGHRNGGANGAARDELGSLNEAFALIEDPDLRRSVVALVRSLTGAERGGNRILR
jgi:transcriptional regulator with XRE-family HTH domain